MRRFILASIAIAAVVATMLPASAGNRDVVGLITQAPNRYTATEPGVPVDLHYLFGPYVVPPGQDSNRITLDVPLHTGYIVSIAPDLIDATSGAVPTQQEAHIHHAHWFRVTNDPDQEYYTDVGGNGLSWVFGTGEEKTQGRLDDRAELDHAAGNNWDYGMAVDGTTPQAMIYMIHNKLPSTGKYFVVLDVTFIPGTAEEIEAVTGRPMHALYGQLWGQTKNVTDSSPRIGADLTVGQDSVGIASGGHLHPGGKMVVVSNLGSKDTSGKTACERAKLADPDNPLAGDPDGDGYLGVAILNSYKYDHNMAAWPYSEDYQMGATKYGWRAPLHAGDVLRQDAPYAIYDDEPIGPSARGSIDGIDHNWYQAMSFTGIYMDRRDPGTPAGVCSIAALGPDLLGADTFDTQGLSSTWTDETGIKPEFAADVAEISEDYNLFLSGTPTTHERAIHGMVNHPWFVTEALCAQPNMPGLAAMGACDGGKTITTAVGPEVTSISAAGFAFLPGDLNVTDLDGAVMLPQVKKGTSLTLLNEDAALNIRHTFTSCAWPCIGTYVSNFPLSDGGANAFDTGKLGNVDPIDGGITGSDTVPMTSLDTSTLDVGKYAYFCRIHPFMRGGFEVVA